jgi:ribosome maturation factor RimP
MYFVRDVKYGLLARFCYMSNNSDVLMSTIEQVEPLIAKKCTEAGFELFEARFFRAGSRAILRVFIDGPKGVLIADCEQISHALSEMLDAENFLDGRAYTLEVSSPGIDRPLRQEREFRRVTGRNVVVYLEKPVAGKLSWKGVVERCENEVLQLSVKGRTVEIPLGMVTSGKEEIKFK